MNIILPKKMSSKNLSLLILTNVCFCISSVAQQTSGLMANIITEKNDTPNVFPLVNKADIAATLHYDTADFKGVIRAIGDLQTDIKAVTGVTPKSAITSVTADGEIIIGTLGKSKLIDELLKNKRWF
jgi:hypothetical protein